MGELLVRDLSEATIRALEQRARRAGRSVEAEHRALLEQALSPDLESFAVLAARMRARNPSQGPDSATILRADRDRDCSLTP